jgi:hypothetical protein
VLGLLASLTLFTVSTIPWVFVRNSPPVIVSSPPARLEEGTSYRYDVEAEDADGDPLRFSLEGDPPEGMVMDRDTGIIEWQVEVPEGAVTYTYEVVAEDQEGARAIQKVTLAYTP